MQGAVGFLAPNLIRRCPWAMRSRHKFVSNLITDVTEYNHIGYVSGRSYWVQYFWPLWAAPMPGLHSFGPPGHLVKNIKPELSIGWVDSWVGSTVAKVQTIWKDYVNAVKAGQIRFGCIKYFDLILRPIWRYLTGTENRSEGLMKW